MHYAFLIWKWINNDFHVSCCFQINRTFCWVGWHCVTHILVMSLMGYSVFLMATGMVSTLISSPWQKKWHVTWWNNCMTCQKHSQCISTGIEFARSICGRLAASLERLEKGRQYRSCSGPKNENTSRHAMPWYYGTLLCNTISDKNIYADRIWHFCYYLSDKGACFFFSSNCKIIAFSRRVM